MISSVLKNKLNKKGEMKVNYCKGLATLPNAQF